MGGGKIQITLFTKAPTYTVKNYIGSTFHFEVRIFILCMRCLWQQCYFKIMQCYFYKRKFKRMNLLTSLENKIWINFEKISKGVYIPLPRNILLRGNCFFKWMELSSIEMFKVKVNSRNDRRNCDMFKFNSNDSIAMTSFCSVVDRVL